MEQYEYFCAISKKLYKDLEEAAAICVVLRLEDMNVDYWEARKTELLHKIEKHLEGLEMALFEKENNL